MSLAADPASCTVPAAGGVATHNLVNSGAAKLAFKVKSSNNNEYRIKPVFGFVEPGASTPLEITRTSGAPKEDKLVIQYQDAPADCTNAQDAFKSGTPQQIVLPLKAE